MFELIIRQGQYNNNNNLEMVPDQSTHTPMRWREPTKEELHSIYKRNYNLLEALIQDDLRLIKNDLGAIA